MRRLRIVTLIEQGKFVSAVKLLRTDMDILCANSLRSFDVWFSFDGLLDAEDWAEQSQWLHERPALRRAMHWRTPPEAPVQIHHPLTLLKCDAYAEADSQTYEGVYRDHQSTVDGELAQVRFFIVFVFWCCCFVAALLILINACFCLLLTFLWFLDVGRSQLNHQLYCTNM